MQRNEPYATPSSILDLFRQQVHDQPEEIAVSKEDAGLTYAALDSASDAIAALLQRRGVVSGDIVPVVSSRCLNLPVYILAILKLGAAFVPIEASTWSRTRIDTVLAKLDFHVAIITTDEQYCVNTIYAAELEQAVKAPCDAATRTKLRPVFIAPRSWAYIIFTSGTTSTPKGVCVAHESLLNCVAPGHQNAPFNFGVRPGDVTLALFSIAFDSELTNCVFEVTA